MPGLLNNPDELGKTIWLSSARLNDVLPGDAVRIPRAVFETVQIIAASPLHNSVLSPG
jgi:hypothetical protein